MQVRKQISLITYSFVLFISKKSLKVLKYPRNCRLHLDAKSLKKNPESATV